MTDEAKKVIARLNSWSEVLEAHARFLAAERRRREIKVVASHDGG